MPFLNLPDYTEYDESQSIPLYTTMLLSFLFFSLPPGKREKKDNRKDVTFQLICAKNAT